VQGLGAEAPRNKVKEIMHLWQKWQTMRGGRITWERDGELLEWCMACYRNNAGAEWLAPFANNFAPAAPSFDEELEALLAEEELLVVTYIRPSKGFVATGGGKGLQQGQEEEEKGAKEKTPKTTAGAATGVARKAPAGGAKGLASPTKKGSSTKLASKRRGCQAPRYEVSSKVLIELTIFLTLEQVPTKQDFLDKELACLLAPR
ncbi:hypothetical protein C0993_007385, partial [Termitomyces sp. T159_Od127]